jgi:glycolate oxidase iron-sulfur subunit
MRAVHHHDAPIDSTFVHVIETCVQCRGCEPACPSGVPFGRLMEGTRNSLAATRTITPRWQRWGFAVLGHHRLLLAGSTVLAVSQRLRVVPKRLGLGRLPLRRGRAVPRTGTDTWLFTGCVMDAWMRGTHRSTARVLDALGVTYRAPGNGGACCGALHAHAGLGAQARRLAQRVIASMPGDAPVLVNSAGCGAALKDYGHLLGTAQAVEFSARVRDIHEYVAPRLAELTVQRATAPIVVQDPCHLRHVQRSHAAVRAVLAAVGPLVELDDDGLCCGAGGAYSALQPSLAGDVRARKLASIARADASGERVVASANPGCAMHLQAAGVIVRHPIDLLAEAMT